MCYFEKTEYRIRPVSGYKILRFCPGCGGRSVYGSTGNFRVNANGRQVDVWLIYQCGKCRHTFNLTIYERRKNTDIPAAEYQRFLDNDTQLAEEYGREIALFQKNRAEIDHKSITYELIRLRHPTVGSICAHPIRIAIQNPYSLKIRPEKLAAEILGRSASQVKKEIAKGTITIEFIKRRADNEAGNEDRN